MILFHALEKRKHITGLYLEENIDLNKLFFLFLFFYQCYRRFVSYTCSSLVIPNYCDRKCQVLQVKVFRLYTPFKQVTYKFQQSLWCNDGP